MVNTKENKIIVVMLIKENVISHFGVNCVFGKYFASIYINTDNTYYFNILTKHNSRM
jgi:hypothetical protein